MVVVLVVAGELGVSGGGGGGGGVGRGAARRLSGGGETLEDGIVFRHICRTSTAL